MPASPEMESIFSRGAASVAAISDRRKPRKGAFQTALKKPAVWRPPLLGKRPAVRDRRYRSACVHAGGDAVAAVGSNRGGATAEGGEEKNGAESGKQNCSHDGSFSYF